MTNTQLYFSVGMPLLAILIGFILNFSFLKGMKTEIRELRSDLGDFRKETNGRLLIIEGDLRQFYSITGEHKGRLEELSKKR